MSSLHTHPHLAHVILVRAEVTISQGFSQMMQIPITEGIIVAIQIDLGLKSSIKSSGVEKAVE